MLAHFTISTMNCFLDYFHQKSLPYRKYSFYLIWDVIHLLFQYYRYMEMDQKFLNFIPLFSTAHETKCGANLGTTEPLDYPTNYIIDERSTIIDVENNITRLE